MNLRHLLFFSCFLLAACSSSGEEKTATATPATLKHLQQDKIIKPNDQADDFTVSLIPEPLTTTQQAEAIISGCRNNTGYVWAINAEQIPEASVPRLSASYYQRGDIVSVLVTCGEKSFETSARVENSPPVISAVKFAPAEIISGTDLNVIPAAEDPDGDPIEFIYQWSVNGESLPTVTGPLLPGNYVARGNQITLEVIPADQFSDGPVFAGRGFRVPNSPPKITSKPPQTFADWSYDYQVVATDPDSDKLSFRLGQAPDGMSISTEGLLYWPLEKVPAGEYTIEIVASDPDGLQSRQTYTLNLSAPE